MQLNRTVRTLLRTHCWAPRKRSQQERHHTVNYSPLIETVSLTIASGMQVDTSRRHPANGQMHRYVRLGLHRNNRDARTIDGVMLSRNEDVINETSLLADPDVSLLDLNDSCDAVFKREPRTTLE